MDKKQPNTSMILQLQTPPAILLSTGYEPKETLTRYRKELLKIGNYVKASTNQAFKVTSETLDHLVSTFHRWTKNGNKVSLPLGHERADKPESNQGWVVNLFREETSLFGLVEILNPELALTTDVSICIEGEVIDGKGHKYSDVITHVALCTDPVVGGLGAFEKLSLSLNKGVKAMEFPEFLKKIAEKLHITGGTPTGEAVMLALENQLPADPVTSIKLSGSPATDPLVAAVVKQTIENRSIKLSGLVKAGKITPAVKDVIAAKYVETNAVTLELSKGVDDGFDLLYQVLAQGVSSTILDEQTSVQSLELANKGAAGDEGLRLQRADINKRRVAAGLVAIN